MKRICNQCQTEMIDDCEVNVQGHIMAGVHIKKSFKGLFNNASDIVEAAVCPNCGCVVFYIDNYKDFAREE